MNLRKRWCCFHAHSENWEHRMVEHKKNKCMWLILFVNAPINRTLIIIILRIKSGNLYNKWNVYSSELLTISLHLYNCYFTFQGLKTGMYYLRTKPAANAIQFTVDKSKIKKSVATETTSGNRNSENGIRVMTEEERLAYNMAGLACSLDNKDDCMMCGSWIMCCIKFPIVLSEYMKYLWIL